MPALPLAIFGDLGFQELLLVALASVMIFGRRLPEVAGRGFAQFQRVRRTLTQMWRETGIEQEMRRIQRDLERQMPRDIDPAGMARRETQEIERALRGDARSLPRPAPNVAPRSPAPQPAWPEASSPEASTSESAEPAPQPDAAPLPPQPEAWTSPPASPTGPRPPEPARADPAQPDPAAERARRD